LNPAKAEISRTLCLDLFGPAIVKCFSQCGLGVFLHFESGRVPDQRYEHQRNDADVERDDSDSFKFVFHLRVNASVGEHQCSAKDSGLIGVSLEDNADFSLRRA
jgi:hypothetical protein